MAGELSVRPLTPDDLAPAVALDAAVSGHRRQGYFEKRLAAALRAPEAHLQYGIDGEDALAGMVLTRVLAGEFGQAENAVLLEVIDVAADAQHHGLGHRLLAALEEAMRRRGIATLQTEINWSDSELAHFFAGLGFRKGPWHVIDCDVAAAIVAERRAVDARLAEAEDDVDEAGETDYSGEGREDFARLSRDDVTVRSLGPDDLAGVIRVDKRNAGRERAGYMQAKLDEALLDSAVRVSLAAEIDGQIAGFLMARIDFGDFGRTEAVAVLDTIDVAPEWSGKGVGAALMSQLFVNLSALQVESLETRVGRDNFDLLRFLYRRGFEPSQRIALVKQVG